MEWNESSRQGYHEGSRVSANHLEKRWKDVGN
jgi:hypothetical protein